MAEKDRYPEIPKKVPKKQTDLIKIFPEKIKNPP